MKIRQLYIRTLLIFIFCPIHILWARDLIPNFKTSKKTTYQIPKGQDYTFGYLEVLENREDPSGNTIKLPVYIFKSRSNKPAADPIIYTVGGPGSSTMRSAKYMEYYKYLDDRDFILFEQRGTEYAQPSLDCPEWAEAQYLSSLAGIKESESDSLFESAAMKCRERLSKQGINLNYYNTNEIAADINDLVQVLGIGEYNLLTLSYSTKIAQVLLRDYPKGIRSVVMDSPLPLEVNYDEESVANLLETLELVLTDCEMDLNCATRYPNIKQRFFSFLENKTIDPLVVKVENPTNKKIETFYLRGADLISIFTLASTSEVKYIPNEINKLLNGDYSSLKGQLNNLFQSKGKRIGLGMRLSVWCAEELPFNDVRIIETETYKYPAVAGLSPAVFKPEICTIWGVEKVPETENVAVKSTIPILLINGEYDNETPVKWAEAMLENFTNGQHIIFKGWKHGPTTNWNNSCAMQTANDFFNQPRTKINSACLSEIKNVSFN